jgi:hypothetical protein
MLFVVGGCAPEPERADVDAYARMPVQGRLMGDSVKTCMPHAMTSFVPEPWAPPPAFHAQDACTEQQAMFVARCLLDGPDGIPGCTEFLADRANAKCLGCAVSPIEASPRAPIVKIKGEYWPNFSACIARMSGDVSNRGCGAKYWALDSCERAACADVAECGDFTECQNKADLGVCANYISEALCNNQYAGCTYDFSTENLGMNIKLFCSRQVVNP